MIVGELLDTNCNSYQTKATNDIMARADVFGLVSLVDLTMIKGLPLINSIASSSNVPVDVLVVKYFSKHFAQGRKKDPVFISESFKPYLEQYNDKKSRADLVFFDVASNVHKAGHILAASHPWINVLYKYTFVPYIYTFLHNTYNLEDLVTVGSNEEFQSRVLYLQGFLFCSTRSIYPPFKYDKQRAQL